ncbi:MAG: FIST N-terminal domain-containing protein [Rubrivivax sp.]
MSPPLFVVGHAAHAQWSEALEAAAAQIERQLAERAAAHGDGLRGPGTPTLGWVYITEPYATAAQALLAALRQRWPGVAFVGTVGVGVAATGVEHFDEPALVVMLASLPREQFQVFSGTSGLRGAQPTAKGSARRAITALVHADPATPELPELLSELADRTESGYLFGGVSASRQKHVQFAEGVFEGGLSGVAFGPGVRVVSRVTQGCTPLGASRRVTACDGTVVLALDGAPALPQLLADLKLVGDGGVAAALEPRALREALPRLRRTLVGLTEAAPQRAGATLLPRAARASIGIAVPGDASKPRRGGNFGEEVRVRHLIGLDPARQGFAIAEGVHTGMGLTFCERDAAAARRDLVRMCTEIRDEVESRAEAARPPERAAAPPAVAAHAGAAAEPAAAPAMLGAIYVDCSGRGGPHFGGPSAELQIVRHALGDVPLAGFFAAGEIAHRQLYGYTGVLTVFCAA